MKEIPTTTDIMARVKFFLYGVEDPFDATPETIAYFYQCIRMRPDFIEKRAKKHGDSDLIIQTNSGTENTES